MPTIWPPQGLDPFKPHGIWASMRMSPNVASMGSPGRRGHKASQSICGSGLHVVSIAHEGIFL